MVVMEHLSSEMWGHVLFAIMGASLGLIVGFVVGSRWFWGPDREVRRGQSGEDHDLRTR